MNAKSEAMYLSYGDPKTVERLMETARNYGRIIETNSKGHTHVVSSYYSGTDVIAPAEGSRDFGSADSGRGSGGSAGNHHAQQ